jgi:hypothetical protein
VGRVLTCLRADPLTVTTLVSRGVKSQLPQNLWDGGFKVRRYPKMSNACGNKANSTLLDGKYYL